MFNIPIKNHLIKTTVSLFAVGTLLTSTIVKADDILTATPVTYMLATELTKGTEITTRYLPPKRYGVSRLPNWFNGIGAASTVKAGEKATVAITLGAIWPQDALFVHARQGNIGLIEIDASQAISPRAQGVAALRFDDGRMSLFVWLNPANLTRMTAIVSQDLQRVWPQQAKIIEKNQQQLMIAVRQLINKQQQVLIEKEIDSVVLLSEELEDFASGNQLFVVERLTKPELEWTENDKQTLITLMNEDETLWLLTSKKVSKQLQKIVSNPERIMVIDSVDRWGGKGITPSNPLERWELKL